MVVKASGGPRCVPFNRLRRQTVTVRGTVVRQRRVGTPGASFVSKEKVFATGDDSNGTVDDTGRESRFFHALFFHAVPASFRRAHHGNPRRDHHGGDHHGGDQGGRRGGGKASRRESTDRSQGGERRPPVLFTRDTAIAAHPARGDRGHRGGDRDSQGREAHFLSAGEASARGVRLERRFQRGKESLD